MFLACAEGYCFDIDAYAHLFRLQHCWCIPHQVGEDVSLMPPGPVCLVALKLVDVVPVAALIPRVSDTRADTSVILPVTYNCAFRSLLGPCVSMSHVPARICSVDGACRRHACLHSIKVWCHFQSGGATDECHGPFLRTRCTDRNMHDNPQ